MSRALVLRALKYPHGNVELSNTEAVRKLVVWLENLKIREYKIADRKALADTSSAGWDAAFKKYLADLECPVPPTDLRAALDWLLAYALNLDYEDNADKLSSLGASGQPAGGDAAAPASTPAASTPAAAAVAAAPAPSRPAGGVGGVASREQAFTDLADPEVAAAVQRLIRVAQVAADGAVAGGEAEDAVQQLQAAAERLAVAVGPALHSGAWTGAQRPAETLRAAVPLGFELTGGPGLCTAAAALRLLYARDLRLLQSQIDLALVEMQEYTANPKTDASLGKVGR